MIMRMDEKKLEAFLEEAGSDYGYGLNQDEFKRFRDREYPALQGTCYLDHAASPPPPISAVESFAKNLSTHLYSNPHSRSPASNLTLDEIEKARQRVLSYIFGLKSASERSQWDVVFTAGTTAALKLVGESFAWEEKKTVYRYLKEAHTSLVGVRGCALQQGAKVEALESTTTWEEDKGSSQFATTLFGYPAQDNASGKRYGLDLGRRVKRDHPNTTILMDAAAYISTSVLDLSSVPLEEAPDFIACSLYKIFGYPTGLGCLIVKRSSGHLLQRRGFFGGGTIDALSVLAPFWSYSRQSVASTSSQLPTIHESFEDGTLNYLGVLGLKHAMDTHARLYGSLEQVSKHVATLTRFALRELSLLRHANGFQAVRQYKGVETCGLGEHPGPIIGFSLLDDSEQYIGHVHLDRLATINGVQLRTGGLCNTGALNQAFGLDDADLKHLHGLGRVCGDDEEFGSVDPNNPKPLGLARISFGAASTIEDVLELVDFLRRYFVICETVTAIANPSLDAHLTSKAILTTMTIYPIKSCGGQTLPPGISWDVTPTGLAFDREWMLINSTTGRALSQKQYPRLTLIRPTVDLISNVLRVTAPGKSDLILPLCERNLLNMGKATVCADVVDVSHPSLLSDEWVSSFIGVECSLRRLPNPAAFGRHSHFDRLSRPVPILLSNESPFLIISQSSSDQIEQLIQDHGDNEPSVEGHHFHSSCFRANFVFSSLTSEIIAPFLEDGIDLLRIGTETFQALARCRRCLMICVDQTTGQKMKEPFSCLAKHRRGTKGRIEFGIHLLWREDLSLSQSPSVRVGDPIQFASLSHDIS